MTMVYVWVSTVVTFVLFTIEAIITYNLGKHRDAKMDGQFFLNLLKCPPLKELFKILINVAMFSFISAMVSNGLAKAFKAKK
jgi:hypothetical protein